VGCKNFGYDYNACLSHVREIGGGVSGKKEEEKSLSHNKEGVVEKTYNAHKREQQSV